MCYFAPRRFQQVRQVRSLDQCLKLSPSQNAEFKDDTEQQEGESMIKHSERCEAEALRLEEKAVGLRQLLGVLLGEDDYVQSLIRRHKQDAEFCRRLATRYRAKGL